MTAGIATAWGAQLATALTGDHLAVADTGDTRWSGRELGRRIAGAARRLDAAGVPAGTVPAVLASTPATLAAAFAGALTQRPLAVLSPRHTGRELAECVAGLPGGHLLTDEASREAATGIARTAGRRLVVLGDVAPCDDPLPDRCAPDDVAFMLHTSGTTGRPRAVPVRHGPLGARARVNAAILRLGPGDRHATSTGFHHISGLGAHATAVAAGAATVVSRGWSDAEWAAWAALGVTHALLVPTMIGDLLAAGTLATPNLRCLQYGAAPIRADVLAAALAAVPGVDLVQFYGQTEGTPISVLTARDHRRAAAGEPDLLDSVGRPAPGTEVTIRRPDAEGVGEVVVRADHVFAPGPDGRLATGDLGRFDASGYLHLVGRRGDKIVRGGENVYPAEVERVLAEHPGVADVAVCGIPHPRLGEVPKAWLVPSDPSALPDADELREWARARLAGFKVPTAWAFLDALPRNPGGKVLRRLLTTPPEENP